MYFLRLHSPSPITKVVLSRDSLILVKNRDLRQRLRITQHFPTPLPRSGELTPPKRSSGVSENESLNIFPSTPSASATSNFHDFGWPLLLWQKRDLPADADSHILDSSLIPPFPSRNFLVPLWDLCTNWRVLQATEHQDNLMFADDIRPISISITCSFEHAAHVESPDRPRCGRLC